MPHLLAWFIRYREQVREPRLHFLLALPFVLSACASEPPPTPPSELLPFSNKVELVRTWSANTGKSGRGLFEPFVDEQQVVVANRAGQVSSLDRESGKQLWIQNLDVTLTSGIGGSVARLFVSDVNAVVHALDVKTGESLWQAPASSEVLMPVVNAFGVAVMRSTDGRIVALEPDTGEERWTVSNTPPALTLNGYSRPLLLDGGVLVGLDDGRLLALNMSTGKLIWESVLSVPSGRSEVERLVDIDADLAIDNEGIYVANYQGRAARVEPSRGQIVWSVPVSVGAGIALDESGLVVIDESDKVQKLDKSNGQLLWSNDTMQARRLTPPAITSNGDIVVGDVEGYLHVLSGSDGSVLGRGRLGDAPIAARPTLVDDTMYVQATDGRVASYRIAQ